MTTIRMNFIKPYTCVLTHKREPVIVPVPLFIVFYENPTFQTSRLAPPVQQHSLSRLLDTG